jgi:hypothetical protein
MRKMHHNSFTIATIALLPRVMMIAATEEVQGQLEKRDVLSSSSPSPQTSFLRPTLRKLQFCFYREK